MMDSAIREVEKADRIIVVGTSLQVYPASSLVHYASPGAVIHLVDPNPPELRAPNLEVLEMGAVKGLNTLLERLTS